MSEKKGVALRELYWKTLVLGAHQPSEFDGGRFRSDPGEQFPIDIVIGLDKLANIYKVAIDVDEEFTPSKVTIRIGKGDVNAEVNYKNARQAKFQKPVVLEFYKRERSMSRMETKNAFTDAIGQYVWLNIDRPIDHVVNPHKMIQINKLTILGYPIPVEKIEEKSKHDDAKESQTMEEVVESRAPSRSAVAKKNIKVERYSYEGDGMNMNTDGPLGGDPLSSIRTIRRVLEDKMNKSNEEGKTIQATVCLRAIQRIDEYETRIEDLGRRRSAALQSGDTAMAERHRLAMIDCRDTVFRAVHIDLLLTRDELRAIGVQSEWADEATD
ncbi:unnamed protein product [Caenorhabditis bovis]|uniref:Centrosomal protein CEP104 N-terminal domain-containing protein n=1 Tax=Caenorhabditis bovis TaxID=2654633 RepID=A0A8S1EVH4_9PELO|nr:unnamed protein product [Caenorhabditis bovis]